MNVAEAGSPRPDQSDDDAGVEPEVIRERARELRAALQQLSAQSVGAQMRGFLQVVALRDMLAAVKEWAQERQRQSERAAGGDGSAEAQARCAAARAKAEALGEVAEFLRRVAGVIAQEPACDRATRTFAGRIAAGLDTSHITPIVSSIAAEMLLPRELVVLYPRLP